MNRRISLALLVLGAGGVLLGAAMALYSLWILRPKMEALVGELQNSTVDLGQLAGVAEADSRRLFRAIDATPVGTELARRIPEGLAQLNRVLVSAASASRSAGKTAGKTTEGLRGLVVPKQALEESDATLSQTSEGMHRLARTVGALATDTRRVSREAGVIAREMTTIEGQLVSAGGLFARTRFRAGQLHAALREAALPTQASLLGLGLAGLYGLIGIFAFVLGLALRPAKAQRDASGSESAPGIELDWHGLQPKRTG